MNPRLALALYLAAVIAITFVHAPAALAVLFAGVFILSGKARWRLLRKTALAIVAFNLSVSLAYAGLALWRGDFHGDTLLLLNLRALLLVYLGFCFVAHTDLLAALAPFPLLCLIATLAISQIKTFERILRDFRMAFASRNPAPPRLRDQTRHAAAQAQTLLDKALASAGEAALAMRSRGAFDD